MPRDFLDWREQQKVFDQIAFEAGGSFTLLGSGEPEQLSVGRVSAGFFEMLRVRPLLGRVFTTADEFTGRDRVVILSHGFWQASFGGRADAVGSRLHLNDGAYEIIGVLPEQFQSPVGRTRQTPIFLPFTFTDEHRQYGVVQSMWGSPTGRLARGVTVAQAEAAMSQLQSALDVQHQGVNKGDARPVAVINQAAARQFWGEDDPLGDRIEILALFLKQGALVLGAGILAGLVGAWMLARSIQAFLFEIDARDPIVFAAVALLLGAAGLMACWIPARRATRVDPVVALKAE